MSSSPTRTMSPRASVATTAASQRSFTRPSIQTSSRPPNPHNQHSPHNLHNLHNPRNQLRTSRGSGVRGATGIFFDTQTPDALSAGVRAAEATRFDAATIRRHAEQFSRQRFIGQIEEFVARSLENAGTPTPAVPARGGARERGNP